MPAIIRHNSILRPPPPLLDRLASGAVARWKFDETSGTTAADQIGSADLTHTGTTVNQSPLHRLGASAYFDGASVAGRASAVLSATTAYTLEAIIRVEALTDTGMVINVGGAAGNFIWLYVESDGVLHFEDSAGGTVAHTTPILPGSIYHVAGVRRSGRLYVYVNGVEVAAASVSDDPGALEALTTVGAGDDGGGGYQFYFTGHIDEAAVYPTGLSAATILSHSQAALSASDIAAKEIDRRIAGLTPATAKPIYSAINDGTASYTRSGNVWSASLDLTCISVWNSRYAALAGATLIAPDIIAAAHHYDSHRVGDTVRFVTPSNTVETGTIMAAGVVRIGTTDIRLCRFTAELTAAITPAAVFTPAAIAKFQNNGWRVPLLHTDQERKLLVTDGWVFDNTANSALIQAPTEATRLSFRELVVEGDSGNGIFAAIEGRLVMVSHFTVNNGGPAYHLYIAAINAAMTALGSSHQLTTVGLAGLGA